jgi:hypothetical protein
MTAHDQVDPMFGVARSIVQAGIHTEVVQLSTEMTLNPIQEVARCQAN